MFLSCLSEFQEKKGYLCATPGQQRKSKLMLEFHRWIDWTRSVAGNRLRLFYAPNHIYAMSLIPQLYTLTPYFLTVRILRSSWPRWKRLLYVYCIRWLSWTSSTLLKTLPRRLRGVSVLTRNPVTKSRMPQIALPQFVLRLFLTLKFVSLFFRVGQ